MRQLIIHSLNVALVALCSFQSAEVVNLVATNSLLPEPTYAVDTVVTDERLPSEWEARKTILDRNLFGARIAGDEVVEDEVVAEGVEETKLPLVLEATITGSNAAGSRAAILDTRSRTSMVLAVGDPLENYSQVSVASIERRRVVLKNSGRREELLLDEEVGVGDDGGQPGIAAAASSGRGSRAAPARSARRPTIRAARSATGEAVRAMTEADPERELTLEEITAEIQRMQDLEPR